MDKFRRLFEALQAIFGKGYVSKLFGNPSNVIKLPSRDARRFIEKELNILEANDNALKQGKKDLEDLIADPKQLEKLNDQELLTLTNNAERMAQRTGDVTPSPVTPQQNAEIIDMTSKKVVSPEGIASLKESAGQQTPPGTLMGNLESRIKQLEASGEDLSKMKGQTLDDIMKNEGQAQKGMAQAQREGLVKATANDIMIADIKSGKFTATKEMQQEILEGSPKALDHFRLYYGEDALEVLDSLAPDLQKLRSSREAADFAKKQFNFEAKMDRAPGSISMEDAAKAEDEFGLGSLKDDIEDPEEFAVGGRVGFKIGSGKKLLGIGKKLLKKKDNPKRQMTDEEITDFADEFGIDPTEEYYNFDGTLSSAQKILKDQQDETAYMYQQYKAGKLDPKSGEKGRKEFLEKKLEEAEMSGDRRLITPDELEELKALNMYNQRSIDISNPETLDDFANFAKKNDPEGYKKIEDMVNDMNQKRELDNFDVTNRKKNSQGGLNYLLGF